MREQRKTQQLQIRVGAAEKAELRRRAKAAGMGVSAWVLARALPENAKTFQRIIQRLPAPQPSYVLAELNDFLTQLSGNEFASAVESAPPAKTPLFLKTYVAAMVEHAAAKKGAEVPLWARETPALPIPHFASRLQGLRLHLLSSSPAAFRRRNLFVDSSVGDRV
jgi:hypothetical protein